MLRGLALSLAMLMLLTLATCQTFQYSRGWTNGKRAETSPLTSGFDFNKWKIFLRPSDNEEVCRMPCEFVDVLRHCLLQDKASMNDLSDLRRSSAPALETSNSLGY